ncbi:hypothetical protein ABT052_33955 [Streptomyces sp. NPDC002766]|uniref:hypothetical protein n=1 Tax=unclassified Streptomyces TaxID=2593676 RepID=UPI0033327D06
MHKAEARRLIEEAREAWEAEEWLRAADLYERVLEVGAGWVVGRGALSRAVAGG